MTTLQQLAASQVSAEVPINENFDAASPSAMFGRRAPVTSGLTWGYYGGSLIIDGLPTTIADGTVTLSASTTNYVEVSVAGVVAKATSRTAGSAPLYKIVTGTSSVTSITDERDPIAMARLAYGKATIAMADANQTLTQTQALCQSLTCTGTLTAVRDLVVPLVRRLYVVFANTATNGVRVIPPSGTGVTIGVGMRAIVECDGTNVVRVTADV